jgi:hypothetical protein
MPGCQDSAPCAWKSPRRISRQFADEISWGTFWSAFPAQIADLTTRVSKLASLWPPERLNMALPTRGLQEQLCALLPGETEKARFKAVIESSDSPQDRISITQINKVFQDPEADIAKQVS